MSQHPTEPTRTAPFTLADLLETGNVEPHAPLLRQPADDQPLYKIMKIANFVSSLEGSYLHFQRVDRYKDFPSADPHDGEQPPTDRALNKGSAFERAPGFTVADYYDISRSRTYACSFSTDNAPLIWERYGTGDPVGKVGLEFNFAKLRRTLNATIGGVPGHAALIAGDSRYLQFFSINYGLVDYVDLVSTQLTAEHLPNPIVYTFTKDAERYAGEGELRVVLSAPGMGQFARADGTMIEFRPSLQLAFDFRSALADGTITRVLSENDEVARHLERELGRLGVPRAPQGAP